MRDVAGRMLLVAGRMLLLLSTPLATAHLTTVCTSVAPATQCSSSSMIVWLGTYHYPDQPQGRVIITTPTGTEHSFDFTDKCEVNSQYYGLPSQCPGPNLKTDCQLPNDAVVECYKWSAQTKLAYPVQDTCQAMAGVYPYDFVHTQYKAVISQPSSGIYSITTRGTDVNLDPCDDANPDTAITWTPPGACASLPTSMGERSVGLWHYDIPGNYSFPLSFPACGAACPAPSLIPHATAASMSCAIWPGPSTWLDSTG